MISVIVDFIPKHFLVILSKVLTGFLFEKLVTKSYYCTSTCLDVQKGERCRERVSVDKSVFSTVQITCFYL